MKYMLSGLVLSAAVMLSAYAAPVPAPAIEALPATVAGQPGAVVGWGLTLTYTAPSDWVVLNDSFFTGTPVHGTYRDYIANEFLIAGPAPASAVINVPFSRPATGLGEFDINSTAAYTSVQGNLVIDYSIFSEYPNSPTFDPSSFVTSGQASAPVTIDIVPEPDTVGLCLGAAVFALLLSRARAKMHAPLLQPVIRRFFRNDHVVHVAFPQPRGRDT